MSIAHIALAPMLLQGMHGAVPSTPIELVLNASTVTQIVLAVLACLSLLSWGIMFAVWRSLAKAMRAATKFSYDFDRANRLDEANAIAKRSTPSALPRLFLRAMHFVSDARVASQQIRERVSREVGDAPNASTMSGSQVETLHLVLDSEASDERDRIGRFLPWLATIGSVSPLIGLLGTVLGVIDSFLGIASKGSGNLSAVAPGVAEALIATAAALSVAIPATFGYNIFASRLNRFDGRMESFNTAVIALLVREGRV
ncbi:MAG TPA: MotA/TolQ/ExbB proton channel family protein [Gemmatimonadaceae bacterium]|nr:MotA/TolQ/ExbB proton channel family protein [Gemmatimonadaceae bacterium]